MKCILLILGLFVSAVGAFAQSNALAILECRASQLAGTTDRADIIERRAFVRAPDTTFLVAVYANELWVEGDTFKHEKTDDSGADSDDLNYSFLEVTPRSYDGGQECRTGSTRIQ